jgi:hypothetical protein
MVKKNLSVILYILGTILVLILSMFIFRSISHYSHLGPNDEITLSAFTGERIHIAYSVIPAKIATYTNANNEYPIVGLSSADVVLEFLSSSYGITYKAIFNGNVSKTISSSILLKEYSNSYLPKFNFSNESSIRGTKGNDATSIFITFNEDASSNFLYENGEYSHYRDLFEDKDNNIPVKLSNVIVQFISGTITNDENLTSSDNFGNGLLFCSGKVEKIKWSRQKNSEISLKNEMGSPILLNPGSTWWVFVNTDCSVAYD